MAIGANAIISIIKINAKLKSTLSNLDITILVRIA
tara:strand:+ start:112 stop:216 length:105 start_codon:yes stop_codon:yes gene_type:complete